MNNYILTGEKIKKRYGKNTILNDASIHVYQGDIYGLIGKNGSGKTTLLRILTGLIQNFEGTVFLDKTNTHESRFGVVINDPSLFLNMSAFENMKKQARLVGLHDEGQIIEVLKTVSLIDSKDKLVKNFSLGMTQRLRLAMALLQGGDILILDEPMNGLDPNGIADLRELLLNLNKDGMTILISSHILSEVEQIANRIGILHDGKMVQEISTNDTLGNGTSLEKLYMQYTRGGRADD